jgi:hypothetical protein
VISGTINMGLGDKLDRTKTKALSAGGVAIMQPKTNHFLWTDQAAVVQVHGVGPWAINRWGIRRAGHPCGTGPNVSDAARAISLHHQGVTGTWEPGGPRHFGAGCETLAPETCGPTGTAGTGRAPSARSDSARPRRRGTTPTVRAAPASSRAGASSCSWPGWPGRLRSRTRSGPPMMHKRATRTKANGLGRCRTRIVSARVEKRAPATTTSSRAQPR